jgi:hypothetical protein
VRPWVASPASPKTNKIKNSQVLMAHSCNPGYSGSRDEEDQFLKPTPGKVLHRPYLEKTHHKKRADGVAQGAGPEFKPPVLLPKNKTKNKA